MRKRICKNCGAVFGVPTGKTAYLCEECAKIPADQRYDSGIPKSGIVGVTWKSNNKKWQATYRGKYIGLYNTVDEAEKAIEAEKAKQHKTE